ncbi:MAG TPA: 30S ribosomal protein S9 [Candidatus Limnocylindrales bacterium]|nr:30S ribosomal protein S9 [Candidatus Limnocylindrales bacterium]
MAEEAQKIKKNKNDKKEYVAAVGRRKEAVARVRIYEHVKADLKWDQEPVKKGEILVNSKPIADYFPSEIERKLYTEPLRLTNTHQNNFAITIRVTGGGRSGQLDAVIAAIANALNKIDREKHRPILKKKGMLTRDSRIRQRRKVGTGGKSRRKKQSPKR